MGSIEILILRSRQRVRAKHGPMTGSPASRRIAAGEIGASWFETRFALLTMRGRRREMWKD
jgi:hypothetical protein